MKSYGGLDESEEWRKENIGDVIELMDSANSLVNILFGVNYQKDLKLRSEQLNTYFSNVEIPVVMDKSKITSSKLVTDYKFITDKSLVYKTNNEKCVRGRLKFKATCTKDVTSIDIHGQKIKTGKWYYADIELSLSKLVGASEKELGYSCKNIIYLSKFKEQK